MYAVQFGYIEVVKLYLKERINIDYKKSNGPTALTLAAKEGHYEIIKLLLQEKANVNIIDGTKSNALDYSRIEGHKNITKLLLKYKIKNLRRNPYEIKVNNRYYRQYHFNKKMLCRDKDWKSR